MQFQSPLAILDRMYEDIDLGLAFRDVVIHLMVVFWPISRNHVFQDL